MLIVVTYDIADDRRRYRVAKALKDYGRRVQESVFDCILEERRLLELQRTVQKIIHHEEDSVRYYHLCARCAERTEIVGLGTVSRQVDLIFV